MINRLQFIHHNDVFTGQTTADARSAAIDFLTNQYFRQVTRPSLYAEPLVVRYENKENPDEPNIILAIGSKGSGSTMPTKESAYFLIDAEGIKADMEEKYDEIEKELANVAFTVANSDTLKLHKESTENGAVLSGDVKVPEKVIIAKEELDNIIRTNKDGIYSYVSLKFDDSTNTFKFQVNDTVHEFSLPVIESAKYDLNKEALVFTYTNGKELDVDLDDLIGEWTVEGEASNSPIVLTRERVDDKNADLTHDSDKWHDILRADVRIDDSVSHNILEKSTDGRKLFVNGTASNIYYKNNQTVKDALDNIKIDVSTADAKNIIYKKYTSEGNYDGLAADVDMKYNKETNVLTFYTSDVDGAIKSQEFKLNSAAFIDDISYDTVKQAVTIRYKDEDGKVHKTEIDLSTLLDDWVVSSEAHNVELTKQTNIGNKDVLSADVKVKAKTDDNYQILEDRGHELYVKGTADNIVYDAANGVTVKTALDNAEKKTSDEAQRAISAESALSGAIDTLSTTIGSGFTTAKTETVTDKFNVLSDTVSTGISELTNSASTLFAKAVALDEKIEKASGDSYFEVKDTSTVAMHKDSADTKHTVTADVKIAPRVSDNILTIDDEGNGLYATIDYDEENNCLVVSDSYDRTHQRAIPLTRNKLINKVEYSAATEELVITFDTKESAQQEVRVPLTSLIKEWDVANDNHSISLGISGHNIDGQDHLYADVNVPNEDKYKDNAIQIVKFLDDTKTGLYVSSDAINSASTAYTDKIHEEIKKEIADSENEAIFSAKTYADNIVKTSEDSLNKTIESVSGDLKTYADTKIGETKADIDKEIANKGTELQSAINTEKERAISAETALDDAIKSESGRAVSAETALSGAIDSEIERATSAETALDDAIKAENERAISAEAILSDAIKSESGRAVDAETELKNAVDTITSTTSSLSEAIEQETKAREDGDNKLHEKIESASNDLKAYADTKVTEVKEYVDKQDATVEDKAKKYTDEKIKDNTLTGGSTNTADVHVNDKVITADVLIAANNKNIIKKSDAIGQKGIYANPASLTYEGATNTLTFTDENDQKTEIHLKAATFVNSIQRSENGTNIVISYTNADGVNSTSTIDLQDLIDALAVENTDKTINLTLSKEDRNGISTNVLSAEANIANNTDEILNLLTTTKKDANGHGTGELLVNGKPIYDAIASISGKTNALSGLVTNIIENVGLDKDANYSANTEGNYISAATSVIDADTILDQNLYDVTNNLNSLSANTTEKVKDLQSELDAAEVSAFGQNIDKDFTYQPIADSNYISTANSLVKADELLDKAIKTVSGDVEDVYTNVETILTNDIKPIKDELTQIKKGTGLNDGNYVADANDVIISGATSLADADKKLSNEIQETSKSVDALLKGSKTYTVELKAQTNADDNTQVLAADARLSSNTDNLLKVATNNNLNDSANGLYFDGSIDYGMLRGDDNIN